MYALIVVDVQNLLVSAIGSDGPSVVREVNALVERASADDAPILYTRDIEPVELPDGDPERLSDLHPDLDLRGTVVDKGPGRRGRMSGFALDRDSGPGIGSLGPLATELHSSGVTEVTVVGIAADVCVAATARDAVRLGYAATIPLAATGFVHAHPDGDAAAVAELRGAGVTVVGDALAT